ncbi:putative aminotransferase, class I/classII, pyridoxal phosphate-dependent transferase, major [Plasmopara halstedii]
MTNFNTYNYLGNASDPEVAAASKAGIDTYGTTMSSSPIVGQTQLNVDLEQALCTYFNAEASVLFVGGWVANVTTIDALVSKGDLILCDALNHDSCVNGQRLSGATILPFPHNDTKALERMLSKVRTTYRRVLIVIESVYSMDGDISDIHEIIRIKKKYKALLFVDEAHSFGTMGATGRGICEHANVDPKDIDVRMGTMSKALGSMGGFILGSQSLSKYFYDLCIEHKIPIGENTFRGAPVVVVIIGSTIATAKASEFLALNKINVKPIVYPAVEEGKCRLRFFISALHTPKQLEDTVLALKTYLRENVAAKSAVTSDATSVRAFMTNDAACSIKKDDLKIVKKRKSRKKKSAKGKTTTP